MWTIILVPTFVANNSLTWCVMLVLLSAFLNDIVCMYMKMAKNGRTVVIKITKAWIQISRQNYFFSNISHHRIIYLTPILSRSKTKLHKNHRIQILNSFIHVKFWQTMIRVRRFESRIRDMEAESYNWSHFLVNV